jgi:TRAP-type uncharacterized transport system substrate-binding protein
MDIVTLDGLAINMVADLKGKRVSTGLPGSETEIKALRVLEPLVSHLTTSVRIVIRTIQRQRGRSM